MISTWPVLTGDDVLRDTWLFIHGELSVRVMRSGPLELCICGPDCARRIVTVATAEDLPLFLRLHAEALVAEGFSYEGFRVDRRSGRDRRRMERASPARRGRIRRTAAREETIN